NEELAKTVDTNDEWIRERTGITQRHIAAEGELTSHLATEAAQKALEKAGIAAEQVDLIIVATSTPDETFPATAVKVQHALGVKQGAAFDLNAVCSGFLYGLSVAETFIASGKAKTVVVIGAETFTRILDWTDRGTCILFGDGAGALVLQAETGTDRGILHTEIRSDGEFAPILRTQAGVSMTQTAGFVQMEGKEVFRHAATKMADSVELVARECGFTTADIRWLVPHQANQRILQATAKRLNIDDERVIMTVDKHANTSAASIPLALSIAADDGRIKAGDLVATPALGAGLTWGSCLIRW
ncbi:MAG: ketoacyl-ACP synthase III, partial [Alphaproteobacteria bacterium]|nr:ketoacyl-ACP synthase III [Alphaproteobacteria bacterium]